MVTGKDFPDDSVRFGGPERPLHNGPGHGSYYIGEPVAAVAAEDEITAQEAIGLIEVQYEALEAGG